ncbi:D-arabinono-1,4-lactone oxidase [Nocardioides mangrovi]|uniref:FAD-binding protein n=1 Tax=Nocardioides mangrovi TaxID=2874580 RepID=A0ABS7UKE1_9ACTN|nr:D-arabinono-1,4-lactone oxidase [Nocardioides mangrovi]MBZ5741367.1 FAD-binding protein [Nocardioides mangrovi]
MSEWSNWSGLESSRPQRVEEPADVAGVVAAVERARAEGTTVKMVGTGHSFTAISAPEHTMLRPGGMTGIVGVDREAMTVTALAGTPLKDFNAGLEALGLSLHNMGDIAEQTLAGATSTGTHGTGGIAASLAAQIAGLELVTGTGEVVRASETENPDLLEFARVGIGALGVLTRITFKVEPLFVLEATETPMSWDEALDGFDERVATHHHVDTYWFPHTDRLMSKTNDRVATDVTDIEPLSRLREWWDDEFLSNTLFGALNHVTNRAPAIIPRFNQVSSRLLSARSYSNVAHRVFTSPRTVVFREMEYAVPREAGLSALREARAAIDASGLKITFPVEIRVTPADDIPLSTSTGRDSFYLAFHTHRDADHLEYFALLEPIMRAHDGRPHWGKVHTRTAADLAPAYPRFEEFLALRDRLDPDRVFANPYLRRVLGD